MPLSVRKAVCEPHVREASSEHNVCEVVREVVREDVREDVWRNKKCKKPIREGE